MAHNAPPGTAAVVLAAGAGSRFEGPGHKLLEPVGGVAVVTRAIMAPVEAGFAEVLVVTGAVDIEAALASGGLAGAVSIVDNPDWRLGMATSLACGLAAAAERGRDAVVVGLGDMPHVDAADWLAVANCGSSPVAVSRWSDGRRSPPVRLASEVWRGLPTAGDTGARAFWSARPDLVTEVPRAKPCFDVDTRADLDGSPGATSATTCP